MNDEQIGKFVQKKIKRIWFVVRSIISFTVYKKKETGHRKESAII